jgi:hypothetical protein
MRWLLDDAGRRQQIAERAYTKVTRDHTKPVFCKRVHELYEEVASQSR